ncbi:Cytochrome c, mono-and diheme variants [Roseateles sp. YR242]|uniref:cytochrome c n=1 Tax=Roseateles sp. YR242 TaxID=1855305 RepID=UPI0008C38050|nr:cytochrome c [Roseateles sp. YR242]SEL39639.1 Cytochrome c, mono-and diheme variants [Roseateles sp. YR242]
MTTSPSFNGRKRRAFPAVIALVVLCMLGGAGLFGYALLPTNTRSINPVLPAAGSPELAELVKQGRYVAVTGDCMACHTAPQGKPYAGGLAMATPVGTLHTTNITPDKQTGIGNFSFNDFDRAVRHGITPSGDTLYPAMPYPSYGRLSDDDMRALYAYFMNGVAPVQAANPPNAIPWPLSMRWPLALWRKTFAPAPTQTPPGVDLARYKDPVIARGAYLVQGAGHCGSCHTPRASTLQELALDDGGPQYLAGGQVIDGWLASNLRGDAADGLGRWTVQDIVATLKTARNTHAAVVGTPMHEVVTQSTQHMTDEDLRAIAAYLKTLPASSSAVAKFEPNEETARQLRSGVEPNRGAQVYVDNCAACHRTDGKGYAKAFPPIAGNATVLAPDPASLIRLVLAGGELPSTVERPSNLGMPAFADRLSDEEVAQLLTFVRQGWGNQAPTVEAAQVKQVRSELAQAHTGHNK